MYNPETSPEALKRPFHPMDLEWRIGQVWKKGEYVGGKCFAYVTNRAIMDRLDEVVGAENWQVNIKQLSAVTTGKQTKEGFLSEIGIRVGEEWVWKTDGADNTDFEAIKGGISGADKRAAVLWGVGRYLYDLPVGYIQVHEDGIYYENNDKVGQFNWSPPPIPDYALPSSDYVFNNMRDFIRNNYDEKKHSDIVITTLNGGQKTLASALTKARANREDYYLTLFCYEGLKKALG